MPVTIDLRADDCTMPSGVRISPYYILSYPDWAHTVCLDQDDRICVVWQYRHGAARVMMELPGGFVEAGEDPLEAAKRELLEETGAAIDTGDFGQLLHIGALCRALDRI